MLFFYGTGSSTLGTYPLRGIRCVNCGTPDSVSAVVVSRYLQFFWIPVFPIGKRAVTVCSFCKQALEQYQLPPVYQQPVAAAKQQVRPPLTNYIGLVLVGVPFLFLMVVGMFFSAKEAITGTNRLETTAATPAGQPTLNEALLADPQPGDLYAMRNTNTRRYGLMQVARVTPDTVFLQTSMYQPRTIEAVRAHRDSVRQGLNNFTSPMPRTTLPLLNRTGLLTVLR